jgi:uncharacterized protein (TIGR02646 family)
MLYIEKKAPPRAYLEAVAKIKSQPEWRAIQKKDTKAIRDRFDQLPKSDIRDALLVEQHYLCAYCMKRIQNDALHMTIEHFLPLSQDKERALDYRNFLGVCKGGKDIVGERGRVLCCDASKGDETALVINPLDQGIMKHIAYNREGIIYCLPTAGSAAEKINQDINNVLCLNGAIGRDGTRTDTATDLIKGRRDAYRQAQKLYKAMAKQGRLTSAQVRKEMQKIKNKAEYPEFAGTLLFALERKCKQLENQGK